MRFVLKPINKTQAQFEQAKTSYLYMQDREKGSIILWLPSPCLETPYAHEGDRKQASQQKFTSFR